MLPLFFFCSSPHCRALCRTRSFFDRTKTGDITSRLAVDTTTVSDQVSLNLNVMMRSAMQAAVVLSFMFAAQWRLTVVTFIIVPLVLTISKVGTLRPGLVAAWLMPWLACACRAGASLAG